MKNNKIIIGILVLIIIALGVLCILFASGTIKINNNQNTDAKQNDNSGNAYENDYSGTFKTDDLSTIVISKNGSKYSAEISIYKLATFDDGVVSNIKDDILYITATDPNGKKIEFTFNYKTKVLTVTKTTWDLLKKDDKFEFNK